MTARWVIPIESYAMTVMEDISLYSPILRPWGLSVSSQKNMQIEFAPKHIKPLRNLIRGSNSFNPHNGFSNTNRLKRLSKNGGAFFFSTLTLSYSPLVLDDYKPGLRVILRGTDVFFSTYSTTPKAKGIYKNSTLPTFIQLRQVEKA